MSHLPVITSYSIHYTKLYDGWLVAGDGAVDEDKQPLDRIVTVECADAQVVAKAELVDELRLEL